MTGDVVPDLRRLALEQYAKDGHTPLAEVGTLLTEASQHLLHELEVHQIELEMQNDELLRVQSELDLARQKYFELYDMAPVGYMSLAEDGTILEANLTAATLLRQARSFLVRRSIFGVVHKDDQDEYYHYRKRLFASGDPQACDLRFVRPDGSSFWSHLTTTVSLTAEGRSVCRMVFSDITGRKQDQEVIKSEKERLSVTLQSIADGVITTDGEGRIVTMNQAAEALCGRNSSEVLGRKLASAMVMVEEDSRMASADPVESVLKSGQVLSMGLHTMIVTPDGLELSVAGSCAPIRGSAGDILGVVLVVRDVTENRKLAEALQRTDKLDSLGVLAGGIAHDFNNLLAGIFGYISLARDFGKDEPTVRKYLDRAASVFQRAKALTLQLLTFSTGGSPLRRTGLLGPQIRAATTFALSGSNVAFEESIAPDLWLCDYDENQLSQVLDNLVINARQSMPDGGSLRVSAENAVLTDNQLPPLRAGRFLKIAVADRGVGIPRSLLKNIFDPFFTTKKAGHGLGLATCKSIIAKHDGLLAVESEVGVGSVFTFYLPAALGKLADETPPVPQTHVGSGTILVMDDEDLMREIMGAMLASMGYQVVEGKTGEAALTIAAKTPLRAALLDLTVRAGTGGRQILPKLRVIDPNLPVFASSGFSDDPVMARPQDFGFTGSIGKPYLKSELGALLEKHLPAKAVDPPTR